MLASESFPLQGISENKVFLSSPWWLTHQTKLIKIHLVADIIFQAFSNTTLSGKTCILCFWLWNSAYFSKQCIKQSGYLANCSWSNFCGYKICKVNQLWDQFAKVGDTCLWLLQVFENAYSQVLVTDMAALKTMHGKKFHTPDLAPRNYLLTIADYSRVGKVLHQESCKLLQ